MELGLSQTGREGKPPFFCPFSLSVRLMRDACGDTDERHSPQHLPSERRRAAGPYPGWDLLLPRVLREWAELSSRLFQCMNGTWTGAPAALGEPVTPY